MASTDLTLPEEGKYLALNHSSAEIEEIVADNLGGQDVSEFDLTRLKVPSGGATSWEMETLEGIQSVRTFEGVIVYTTQTRSWWPITLDESDSKTPPSCSSPDGKTGYGKQWATAVDPDPEGEPRRVLCATCPHSQFGSGKNGGQACQLKGHWYVLMEGSFLPVVVTLPPMSLKPAKKYLFALSGAGLRYSQVVTRFKLEADARGANKFAKVIPELGGKLSPEEADRARAYSVLLRDLFARDTGAPGQSDDGLQAAA